MGMAITKKMKAIIEKKALPAYSGSEHKIAMPTDAQEDWTLIIKPKSTLFDLQLREVWRYRDLMLLFVRRDFVTFYKQTILGPLWFFLQPILTTVIFTIVFGKSSAYRLSETFAPSMK